MLKGASRAVLKIVEQELHEAWSSGYVEGKSEVALHVVPAILSARFGPEAGAFGATVKLVSPIGSRSSSWSPPPARISSPSASNSCRGSANAGVEAAAVIASR